MSHIMMYMYIFLSLDIQSIPSLWEDLNKHLRIAITDLLNLKDPNKASKIADMAISYYAGDENTTNTTLTGKYIDVSIN